MSHVFLSYSRKDAEIMRQLREQLSRRGLDVWTDEDLVPGTPLWRNAIESALNEAGCVVAIMSPQFKQSEWAEREMSYAAARNLLIIPVLVRGDKQDAVPLELAGAHYVDLRDNDSSVVQTLIATVRDHVDARTSPTPAPPPEPAPRKRTDLPNKATTQCPITRELSRMLSFTIEELHLNRDGRLSRRQRRKLVIKGVFGIAVVCAFVLFAIFVVEERQFRVYFAAGGFAAALLFCVCMQSTTVSVVTGPIYLRRWLPARVCDLDLPNEVTKEAARLQKLHPGSFRVYCLGRLHPHRVLSMEPCDG